MNDKSTENISVLVLDDEQPIRNQIKAFLLERNRKQSEFQFAVDTEEDVSAAMLRLRTKRYDVIVLDVCFPDISKKTGLLLALAAQEELGWEVPVRVVITGYPSYEDCLKCGRSGVSNYIVKKDVDDRYFGDVVVDAVILHIRERQCRTRLNDLVLKEWLPSHFSELEKQYAGKVIALWHEPEVSVVASGDDAFDVHTELAMWSNQHELWEQPILYRLPPTGQDS